MVFWLTMGEEKDPISCLTHNERNSLEMYQDGSEAKNNSKAVRRLISHMNIYKQYSNWVLHGKQEETRKELLCYLANSSTPLFTRLKLFLINQVCQWPLPVQLNFEVWSLHFRVLSSELIWVPSSAFFRLWHFNIRYLHDHTTIQPAPFPIPA